MAHGTARIGKDRYRTEIDVGPHHLVADEPPALGGQAVGGSVAEASSFLARETRNWGAVVKTSGAQVQ